MELTPLRRAASGAVLGGVCAGLARRWQVDPTVLRIAMVLLALLGGVGIAFYVGAVLLIPRDGSSEFPLYRHAPFTRSWSPAAAIGAVVCLGVLIIVLVGSWLPFGLAPAVGLAFLWYFGFHRRRGQAARPPVARPGGTTAVAGPAPGQPPALPTEPQTDFERAAADWRARVAQERPLPPELMAHPTPPSQPAARPDVPVPPVDRPVPDPVGPAAPIEQRPLFAPYPGTPTDPPVRPASPRMDVAVPQRRTVRRPRWLWPLVLCLIGGGLTTLAVLSAVGVQVASLAYPAVVLGALGLGLLIAAFAGRPRGMVPLAVIASVVTLALMVPMPNWGASGDKTLTYTSMAQLPTGEQNHGAGEVTIDLTGLDVTETRHAVFNVGAGPIEVKLPPEGNVIVEWRIGIGDYTGPDERQEGLNLSGNFERIVDPGAATLTLTVSLGTGEDYGDAMKRIDVAALNVGFVSTGIAAIALCSAFAVVDWRIISIVAPLGLVVLGLAGLVLSRSSTKGNQ